MASTTLTDLPPDVNRGPEILATCGSLVGTALVIVILRIWVRIKFIHKLGWDDYLMVSAMTVHFAMMMVIIPEVYYGAGRHVQYIKPQENVVKGLRLNFATQPICVVAICLAKVSVALFLLRISPTRGFRWFILGTTILTVLSTMGIFLTMFFQCTPLAYTWDASIPGGKCLPAANLKFASFFNSALSVLTDLIYAVLPIPMLWNVQLNLKVKAAVAGILSLGIFATAAGIVKTTFIENYGKYGDFLFDSADLTIWIIVETSVAIIAASIPCLKPLFKHMLRGSSAGTYGSNKYVGSKSRKGHIRNPDNLQKDARTSSAVTQGQKLHHRDGSFEMYGEASGGSGSGSGSCSGNGSGNSNPGVLVGAAGGSSQESFMLPCQATTSTSPPGPPCTTKSDAGITKTTHVYISVEEAKERSVKDMV